MRGRHFWNFNSSRNHFWYRPGRRPNFGHHTGYSRHHGKPEIQFYDYEKCSII